MSSKLTCPTQAASTISVEDGNTLASTPPSYELPRRTALRAGVKVPHSVQLSLPPMRSELDQVLLKLRPRLIGLDPRRVDRINDVMDAALVGQDIWGAFI